MAPTQKISRNPPAATEKVSSSGSTRSPAPGPPRPETGSEATLYTGASNKVVAVLIAKDGRLENEVFRIFDGPNKLGRSDHCDVVLASQRISREHALVTHKDGTFHVEPLSERNPTRVNGEPTPGCDLADGDELKLGDTTFRFRSVD